MRSTILAGLTGLAALAACSDGGPGTTGRVEVGFATDASAPASGVALFADTYTDPDGNTLVIDSVSVVLRQVMLEGGAGVGCDDDDGEGEESPIASADSGETEDDEECEIVLRLGPMLVDLPLNGGVSHQFTATVDTGTYTEVKFQIHVPEGEHDAAFLELHPEYAGVSIRVVGSFNGSAFVYTAGVTDVQEVEFDPPLVVTDGSTSFTVRVDLSGWFRTGAGGLIDPATAMGDGANVVLVYQNIIHSFHGFEDEDHDGEDDAE